MPTITSPGGSTFPYYYKGGEIHCLKFGGFRADEAALFAVMKAEEVFIAKPDRRLLVWVDFYETRLTNQVLSEFAGSISRLQAHILKLAVVGFSLWDRLRLGVIHKKAGALSPVATRFFSDPETAKTWLVGKPN